MMTKEQSVLKSLNETIRRASTADLYKEKNLKELSKLSEIKSLPFTTKDDLRNGFPFAGLAINMSKVLEVHTSSGTTGKPAVSFLTRNDINESNEPISRAWKTFGINEESRVIFVMSYGLFSGATINTYAIQHLGAFVLPSGIQPVGVQIELLIDFEIDTIVATPGFLLYLTDYIKKEGIKRENFKLKRAIAAGEVYSEEVRQKIQNDLQIEVFDHYGLCEVNTGIAYECKHHNGLHILDDYVFAEIINPETIEICQEGELGELVLTSLKKEASPIIRYRTGDKTRIISSDCECGKGCLKIERIVGRISETMFIKGLKIDPYELKEFIINEAKEKLNTYDMMFEIKEHDIRFIPKIFLSISEEKPFLLELLKKINDFSKINFEIVPVDSSYFGREKNNKVKIIRYAK
jgi:phenylacetate-CoA ligase